LDVGTDNDVFFSVFMPEWKFEGQKARGRARRTWIWTLQETNTWRYKVTKDRETRRKEIHQPSW